MPLALDMPFVCISRTCVVTVLRCYHTVSALHQYHFPWASWMFLTALLGFINVPLQRRWITIVAVIAVVHWTVLEVCVLRGTECTTCVSLCAWICVLLCIFALCWLVFEQACSLGLWGDVLSADFVGFRARVSYRSIVSWTHHIHTMCSWLAVCIGCTHMWCHISFSHVSLSYLYIYIYIFITHITPSVKQNVLKTHSFHFEISENTTNAQLASTDLVLFTKPWCQKWILIHQSMCL